MDNSSFGNIVDLLALIMLLFYAVSGYRKGALLSICSMFGIVFAYLGAYLFGSVIGNILVASFQMHKVFAMIVGSMVVFFTVSMIFSFIRMFIKSKIEKDKEKGIKLSIASRIIGICVSSLIAFVMISLFIWGYSIARVTIAKEKIPSIHDSKTAIFTKPVVEETAYMVTEAFTKEGFDSRKIAKLVAQPDKALESAKELFSNENFKAVITDKSFMEALSSGDSDQITNNKFFNNLFDNEFLVEKMQDLGMLEEDVDIQELKRELSEKMAGMGDKMKDLLNDAEIKSTMEELKADGLLEANKIKDLIFDDRAKTLVKRIGELTDQ